MGRGRGARKVWARLDRVSRSTKCPPPLADAKVWARWHELDAAERPKQLRRLRRAGVRELWLVGVSATDESALPRELERCGLALRELPSIG